MTDLILGQPLVNIDDTVIETLPRISTHDRMDYRRCRRRWDLQSSLRQNLEEVQYVPDPNLWFGTGFHFALEDYHGWKQFPTPFAAFMAYKNSFSDDQLPLEIDSLIELASGMLSYYSQHWHPQRGADFKTLVIGGIPQVEVDFEIVIYRPDGYMYQHISDPEHPIISVPHYEPWFVYKGTLDRIAVDRFSRYWIIDYKTTKRMDTSNYDTDPQITAYTWAASLLYGLDFEGVVWQQFNKAVPEWPTVNKNGSFSTDKRQKTTAAIYRQALLDKYGTVPNDYYDFLSELMVRETQEGDAFIRWDAVRRNQQSIEAEEWKIIMEASEMLNVDLPIYPNPTRDCSWDCKSFKVMCLMMDDGSDYETYLGSSYEKKVERHPWRNKLLTPKLEPMLKVPAKRIHHLLKP